MKTFEAFQEETKKLNQTPKGQEHTGTSHQVPNPCRKTRATENVTPTWGRGWGWQPVERLSAEHSPRLLVFLSLYCPGLGAAGLSLFTARKQAQLWGRGSASASIFSSKHLKLVFFSFSQQLLFPSFSFYPCPLPTLFTPKA